MAGEPSKPQVALMFDDGNDYFGEQARENQKKLRARMREIIAERNKLHPRLYSSHGECRQCGWKCVINDQTCVVDGDEVQFVYDGEVDWGWTHWCVTHKKQYRQRGKKSEQV